MSLLHIWLAGITGLRDELIEYSNKSLRQIQPAILCGLTIVEAFLKMARELEQIVQYKSDG